MTGHVKFRKKQTREQFRRFMSAQPACVVVFEACGSASYCAREMEALGHDVKLIAPQYVRPFVKLCSPQHNLTYHQVPIMRRNVRKSANFRRFLGVSAQKSSTLFYSVSGQTSRPSFRFQKIFFAVALFLANHCSCSDRNNVKLYFF